MATNILTLTLFAVALLVLAPILLVRLVPRNVETQRLEVFSKSITPLVAVLPIVVGLFEYISNQREQAANAVRTEYIGATQLLMEPDQAKQLSGIAAVAQLAAGDSERTWLMTDSLSTFIRLRAQRSGPATPLDHGRHELAPVHDPPCGADAAVEFHYNYSTCAPPYALYRENPAVQAAIAALGGRNPKLEDPSSPPARFALLAPPPPSPPQGSETARARIIRYIESAWWHQSRRESRDQLVNELQFGRGIDFANVRTRPWLNLSYADLRGADAKLAWFEGGNLGQTDLSFSNLANAKLAKSMLAGAWVVGANLSGTDLRGADLQFADVRGSDLGQSNLRKAWLSGASFSRANFWQTLLESAYLIATDMTDLETASGANLNDIIAYRTDFSHAKIAGDLFFGVCMRNAFLREAKFDRADMRGVDLTGSDLRDAHFAETKLQGSDLRNTQLQGADLSNANLSHADLRGVDLSQTLGTPKSLSGSVTDAATKLRAQWPQTLTKGVSKSPVDISRDCKLERTQGMRRELQGWDADTLTATRVPIKRSRGPDDHPLPAFEYGVAASRVLARQDEPWDPGNWRDVGGAESRSQQVSAQWVGGGFIRAHR